MTARAETETTAAKNLLLDNLPALRERLAQQDIKIQQFERQRGRPRTGRDAWAGVFLLGRVGRAGGEPGDAGLGRRGGRDAGCGRRQHGGSSGRGKPIEHCRLKK